MKKYLSAFVLILVLCVSRGIAHADTFAGGSGTSIDPWQIATCDQLEQINDDLTSNYILNNDLSCSTQSFPLARTMHYFNNVSPGFSGVLNLNNHSLAYNLNHIPGGGDTTDYLGLFGLVNGGTIEGTTSSGVGTISLVDGATLSGNSDIGMVAGRILTGSIFSITSSNAVTGTGNFVGGLVGGEYGIAFSGISYTGVLTGGSTFIGDSQPPGPAITITTPADNSTVSSWAPNIDWDSDTSRTCEYNFDGDTNHIVDCNAQGSDIQAPSAGTHTFNIIATNLSGGTTIETATITYSPGPALGMVKVTVTDNNANLLPNATVEVSCDSSNFKQFGTTDSGGVVEANPNGLGDCNSGDSIEFLIKKSGYITLITNQLTDWFSNVNPEDATTDHDGSTNVYVVTDVTPVIPFSGSGNGTTAPYQITSCSQLQEINNDLTAKYQLTTDLTCTSGTDHFPLARIMDTNGTPTDLLPSFPGFTGTLDGQDHSITYQINIPNDGQDTENYLGLFGFLGQGSVVKNLVIHTATPISGSSFIGALAGQGFEISVDNVSSDATFVGTDEYVGGLLGCVDADSGTNTVSNNTFTGSVTAAIDDNEADSIGGIVGEIFGATMLNNTFDGTITAIGTDDGDLYGIGGIAGDAYDLIEFSHNTSTVRSSITVSVDDDIEDVGMLGGDNEGTNGDNSYSAEDNTALGTLHVTSLSGMDDIGGMFGEFDFAAGQDNIDDVPMTVESGAQNSDGNFNVGGFAGMITSSTIANTFATGNLSVTATGATSDIEDIGGLIGLTATNGSGPSSITDSFASDNVTLNNAGEALNGSDIADSGTGLGGLIGYVNFLSSLNTLSFLTNSYSSGTVTYNDIGSNDGLFAGIGGLVGYDKQGTQYNNDFTVSPISATTGANLVAGLVGFTNGAQFSNNVYDVTSTGQTICTIGGDIGGCTGIDTDGTDSDHFKNNSTSTPFTGGNTSWNFGSVWLANDSYPLLQFAAGAPAPTPTLTPVTSIPSTVLAADAQYHFSASSDIDTAINGDTAQYVFGACGATPSVDPTTHVVSFTGLVIGQTYSCGFHVAFNDTSTSNTLTIGPFTVIAPTAPSSNSGGITGGSASMPIAATPPVLPPACAPGDLFNAQTGASCSTGTSNVVAVTPPVFAPTSSPQFPQTLKIGVSGSDVKTLQQFLNTHGFVVTKTGAGSAGHEITTFGPATKAALIKFQKANNLQADGILGPKTIAVIEKVLNG